MLLGFCCIILIARDEFSILPSSVDSSWVSLWYYLDCDYGMLTAARIWLFTIFRNNDDNIIMHLYSTQNRSLWALYKHNIENTTTLNIIILYSDCLQQEINFLASTRPVTALCVCVCCIVCVCDCVMVIHEPTCR